MLPWFSIIFISGGDPKSVLCAFYKQGMCGKGAKCKFSHDLTIERKSEKRSLYADGRDESLQNGKTDLSVQTITGVKSTLLLFIYQGLVILISNLG